MNRRQRDWSDLVADQRSRRSRSRDRNLIARRHDSTEIIVGDQRWINFGSNDYLGLASQPVGPPEHRGGEPGHGESSFSESSFSETMLGGSLPGGSMLCGSGASPLVTGWTIDHETLCNEVATFEQAEAAVLLSTGYAACCGTVATMANQGDWILSDQLNHASLIDGCRLSGAQVSVYPHRDISAIDDLLRRRRRDYRRVWIVTDGVFSMDGTVAPLGDICDLADKFDANVIVDEAHATGVLGENGRGTCEVFDVADRVSLRIGTFSKAVGAQGGFVVSDRPVIDHLINHCRALIYSTAMSPVLVHAVHQNFAQLRGLSSRRRRVHQLAKRVRQAADIAVDDVEACVPIIAIHVGEDGAAVELSDQLSRRQLFVPAIRPPTVPEGTARLRISLSAAHTDQQIDHLCQSLADLRG